MIAITITKSVNLSRYSQQQQKTDQMNEWIKIFIITQFSIESEIKWNYYYY